MDISEAVDFIRERRNGVLVTQKRDGRPQLSNIVYVVGDDGVIRISITADRAKYANLRRTPLASLYVAARGLLGLRGDRSRRRAQRRGRGAG